MTMQPNKAEGGSPSSSEITLIMSESENSVHSLAKPSAAYVNMSTLLSTKRVHSTQHALPFVQQRDLEKALPDIPDSHKRPTYARQDTIAHLTTQPKSPSECLLQAADVQSASCASSTSTLTLSNTNTQEKKTEGITNDSLKYREPAPKYPYAWMNILRWEWLSVYRRLNLIVLTVNIITILTFAFEGKLLRLDPGAMSTALAANITTAVVFRQEYVVNGLFLLFGCCPPTWPLWIKRLAGKIYHFGGVHSGAGLASTMWLALFDVSLALKYRHDILSTRAVAVITITALLNLLLCCVVISSYPKFREKYHNVWESIHRFGGWLAVSLFWINFGLLADDYRRLNSPQESVFQMLTTSPTFWMLLIVTICLVMPWLRLRKVPIVPEWQSKYAVRYHFYYTNLPLCAAPRFSMSPLMEWHSFAGIPHENGKGFSVLISAVGDWTKKMVFAPPSHIWTRGIPVRGVLHIAPIFRKIVLVATGSGIGPVLSLLCARDVDCRILWCTRDPSATYQPDVIAQVLKADKQARIIARTKGQRDPDLGQLAYSLHQESGAEAVFIISNKEGCYKARLWLESRGIVVFTPIFDS